MILVYLGEQDVPGGQPVQLWNIQEPGHPLNGSTRTIPGLIEAGVIRLAPMPGVKMEIV